MRLTPGAGFAWTFGSYYTNRRLPLAVPVHFPVMIAPDAFVRNAHRFSRKIGQIIRFDGRKLDAVAGQPGRWSASPLGDDRQRTRPIIQVVSRILPEALAFA